MSEDLQAHVAVVTGGAGGIGEAVVARLLAGGARVAFCDIDGRAIERAHARAPAGRVLGRVVDVTNAGQVEAFVREVVDTWGAIDSLVNNAGIQGRRAPVWELGLDEWKALMSVNLDAVFILARAVSPRMIKRRRGVIVNMASQRGKDGAAGLTHYATSKGGVIVFTRSLAKELAPYGIQVHAVAPGPIEAGMGSALRGVPPPAAIVQSVPMGRAGRADEVAELVHVLVSGKISYSTGYCWDLSGGKAVS